MLESRSRRYMLTAYICACASVQSSPFIICSCLNLFKQGPRLVCAIGSNVILNLLSYLG